MNQKSTDSWKSAFLLTIPVFVFFAGYLVNHAQGLVPTGFIQYDNVSYIAYARQYLDAGDPELFYSNPFHIQARPVYFQPQTLFFAFLMWMGIPPGWILIPFTIIFSILSFRLLIAIIRHLYGSLNPTRLNIWMVAWGGGLFVMAGMLAGAWMEKDPFHNLYLLDPENGWWGLNFGRSLLFSCEAYYHFLFLGCLYYLLRKKWFLSITFLALVSISHPFTGLELAGIICAWCAFEFIMNRNGIPKAYILAALLILSFHLYYYLVYLEQFPEHRSVREQYSLNWRLGYYRLIPAYLIAGILAFFAIYKTRFQAFISTSQNRVLLSWFAIAFFLANHEVFMEARQPVHFTRGYVWTSLMLIGFPALHQFTGYLKKSFGLIAISAFTLIICLDNITWISDNVLSKATGTGTSYISLEQKTVLESLDQHGSANSLVVGSNRDLAYLGSVFSRSVPWYSHPYTTPFAAEKRKAHTAFFLSGAIDSSWRKQDVFFILQHQDTNAKKVLIHEKAKNIFLSENYSLYYLPARNR